MAYFQVKKDGKKYYPFGDKSRTEKVCKEFGVEILGEVPLSPTIADGILAGNPILDEEYLPPIDVACDRLIAAEVTKTGLLERISGKIKDSLRPTVEKIIIHLLKSINKDFDVDDIRTRRGLTEEKVFALIITDTAMTKEITNITLRMTKEGIRAVRNPKKIEFEVITDFRTLSRIILRKRKSNGSTHPFDAMDAWLNGDMRVYGLGYSPKTTHAIRTIFMDDEVMSEVGKKYAVVLEKWI